MGKHRTPRGQADKGPPNAISSSPGKRALDRRKQRWVDYLPFVPQQPEGGYRLRGWRKQSKFWVPTREALATLGFRGAVPVPDDVFRYANPGLCDWLSMAGAPLREFETNELQGYAIGQCWIALGVSSSLRGHGHKAAGEELRNRLVPVARMAAESPLEFLFWFTGFRLSYDLLPESTAANVQAQLANLAHLADTIALQLAAIGWTEAASSLPGTPGGIDPDEVRARHCIASLVDLGLCTRDDLDLTQHRAFQHTLSSLLSHVSRSECGFNMSPLLHAFVNETLPAGVVSAPRDILPEPIYLKRDQHRAFHRWLAAHGCAPSDHCCRSRELSERRAKVCALRTRRSTCPSCEDTAPGVEEEEWS